MQGSSDEIHYHVLGISGSDPLSFDCILPGGCIANLRIPGGTPWSTVSYLIQNSNFQNKKKVTVNGPVVWDSDIGAFLCEELSLCP